MAAIYTVFSSPTHPPIPNHLPTLIVTPHGQPNNILYSYLHTNFNTENYLLTPSPQGDLCVAKLFPPSNRSGGGSKPSSVSDPGHGSSSSSTPRVVRCEASRNLKWTITNTGVISPIYKLSLPSPDSPDLPLFQISKPNPNAGFWSMFYFAYAGHLIPPKRIEFGKIQKNPGGPGGGGTRISITGKTPEEKAVWQTLGEGNEDCVEWVVLCAALNLLDDEILKAAGGQPAAASSSSSVNRAAGGSAASTSAGSTAAPSTAAGSSQQQRGPPPPAGPAGRGGPPPQGGPGFRGPPPQQPFSGPPPQQQRSATMPGPGPQGGGFDPRRGPPPQQGGPSGFDPRRGPPPGPAGPGGQPRGPPPQQAGGGGGSTRRF
ncbi:hypothetical protein FRC03_009074 [Tulasnella sp. 419]|nr:hypothetical protein FRC03_009074 [Tulasnella sp. 419]